VRRRNKNDHEPERQPDQDGPALWLRLARDEIALRTQLEPGGRHDFVDHILELEVRLKARYPDMPFEVKNEFSARLGAEAYTEDAWQAAVAWLESTDWFRLRGRQLGST
jgi:hypothetical protein